MIKGNGSVMAALLAAGLTMGATKAAHAGIIVLHEGGSGTQDVVGTLADDTSTSINFKNSNGAFVNDEARSLRLRYVRPGTRIFLYDSPSGSLDDDWVEIRVKKTTTTDTVISNLEQSVDNDIYKVIYHADNGLNGKVSRAKVIKGTFEGHVSMLHAVFEAIQDSLSGFPAKRGQAFEYNANGGQYRVWRPSASTLASGGVLITLKMDHIRGGAKDDHGMLKLRLDAQGKVIESSSNIVLAEDKVLSHTFDAVEGLTEAQRENEDFALGYSITKVAQGLYQDLIALGESGARLFFPDELEHQMNVIGMAALEAIEQWHDDQPSVVLDKSEFEQELQLP